MLLKIIIVFLIIAMLVSLAVALKSLFKGQGESNAPNTYKWLIIRIVIALAILVVVMYGLASGVLTIAAPWSGRY